MYERKKGERERKGGREDRTQINWTSKLLFPIILNDSSSPVIGPSMIDETMAGT